MTCLRCGHINAHFSEVCPNCGVRFRIRKSPLRARPRRVQLDTSPRPELAPISHSPSVSPHQEAELPARVTTGEPSLNGVRRRLSSPCPLTIDVRVLALVVGSVGVGWWVGHSSPPRVVHQPPLPVSYASPPQLTSPKAAPIPQSELAPPSSTISHGDDLKIKQLPAGVTYYQGNFVTSPDTTKSSAFDSSSAQMPSQGAAYGRAPLRFINSHTVPVSVLAQVEPLYHEWEQAHSESASEVEHLLSLYAPDAVIYQLPNMQISLEGLRSLATSCREMGTYTYVNDKIAPQWKQDAVGDEVELLTEQQYVHKSGGQISGQRRLIWKNMDGEWKIIRDDFPPSYS